ncbi:hypothetical protein BKA57DRAFT_251715 [Linnemannia elongata]|nr:hypothetical protein BKA57DRAFT_251715 [Linnemannia elongata]
MDKHLQKLPNIIRPIIRPNNAPNNSRLRRIQNEEQSNGEGSSTGHTHPYNARSQEESFWSGTAPAHVYILDDNDTSWSGSQVRGEGSLSSASSAPTYNGGSSLSGNPGFDPRQSSYTNSNNQQISQTHTLPLPPFQSLTLPYTQTQPYSQQSTQQPDVLLANSTYTNQTDGMGVPWCEDDFRYIQQNDTLEEESYTGGTSSAERGHSKAKSVARNRTASDRAISTMEPPRNKNGPVARTSTVDPPSFSRGRATNNSGRPNCRFKEPITPAEGTLTKAREVELMLDWLNMNNNFQSLHDRGKMKVGGTPESVLHAYGRAADYLFAKSGVRLSPSALYSRWNRHRGLYQATLNEIRRTGFGVAPEDGVVNISELLESRCPGFARMDKLYKRLPQITPPCRVSSGRSGLSVAKSGHNDYTVVQSYQDDLVEEDYEVIDETQDTDEEQVAVDDDEDNEGERHVPNKNNKGKANEYRRYRSPVQALSTTTSSSVSKRRRSGDRSSSSAREIAFNCKGRNFPPDDLYNDRPEKSSKGNVGLNEFLENKYQRDLELQRMRWAREDQKEEERKKEEKERREHEWKMMRSSLIMTLLKSGLPASDPVVRDLVGEFNTLSPSKPSHQSSNCHVSSREGTPTQTPSRGTSPTHGSSSQHTSSSRSSRRNGLFRQVSFGDDCPQEVHRDPPTEPVELAHPTEVTEPGERASNADPNNASDYEESDN